MATKTYAELLAGAQQIKENELPESNTHDLVGEQLVHMVNRASEDKAALDATLTDHQEQLDKLQEDIDGNTEAIHDEQTRAKDAEKANAEAIAAEQARAEAVEKTLEDGIGIIRGSSTMTAEGDTAVLQLKLIIGKGTPITLSLPVHGEDEWNVPADTPALIDPWTFQELMGLFEAIENESKARSDADESLNASVNSLLQHVAKLTMAITPSVVFRSSADTCEVPRFRTAPRGSRALRGRGAGLHGQAPHRRLRKVPRQIQAPQPALRAGAVCRALPHEQPPRLHPQ